MASMKLEEQLEEQPPEKKPRIDNCQEKGGNASNPNDSELPKSPEGYKYSFPTTTIVDLPPSAHRPLPLEMNCEMYKFLTLPIQRKFIWVMGRGIYAMFRQKVLRKSTRLCNSTGNVWSRSKSSRDVTISEDGLNTSKNNNTSGWKRIYSEKGFPISVAKCRADDFPDTICYYYEVISLSGWCVVMVGLLLDGYHFGASCGCSSMIPPLGFYYR